jgi:hypothetical protein
MKTNIIVYGLLALTALAGCDSVGEGGKTIDYYVKGNAPLPAERADIMVVAPDAAGPGQDTLRFADEPLPWRLRLDGVGEGALVLEACVESGIVEAHFEIVAPLEDGVRSVTEHGAGREYVPFVCAWGRIGRGTELPPPPRDRE